MAREAPFELNTIIKACGRIPDFIVRDKQSREYRNREVEAVFSDVLLNWDFGFQCGPRVLLHTLLNNEHYDPILVKLGRVIRFHGRDTQVFRYEDYGKYWQFEPFERGIR